MKFINTKLIYLYKLSGVLISRGQLSYTLNVGTYRSTDVKFFRSEGVVLLKIVFRKNTQIKKTINKIILSVIAIHCLRLQHLHATTHPHTLVIQKNVLNVGYKKHFGT